MTKRKAKIDKGWAAVSDAFCDAQNAATDAFSALLKFDLGAPSTGGQKAYDKWRDANFDARAELERATIDAARNYIVAHLAELNYLELS